MSDCVEHIGLAQGRVSTHLACLTDCGFVEVRRDGRFTRYKVGDPRVAELVLLARAVSRTTSPRSASACASTCRTSDERA